jgi:antitoxin MazE
VESRVGKKNAIYLPKAVVEATGLKEGGKILLRVMDKTVVVEPLMDPLELALSSEKYATIDPEQIEAISVEEQGTRVKGSWRRSTEKYSTMQRPQRAPRTLPGACAAQ